MTRVALVSSEPIRARMGGIGIRYLELARRLPRPGIEVVLLSPGDPSEAPEVPGEVRRVGPGDVIGALADCDIVVAQGQLANEVVLGVPEGPVAIDLYDPFLIENFAYAESLGLDPYRNDHASWVLQLGRGDFFLCSSQEQRLYYLGWLTALGRVNPESVASDPDLARLISVLPFGVPERLPPHRPILPERAPEERRILFGGLYDWYDPWPLLEALPHLPEAWRLLLVANPNPDSTPQRLLARVESYCRERDWWGGRVSLLPWVEAERRFDLLRDVDVLAAPHRPSLETKLSLRTRFLDALAAGCPVALTADGAMSRWVAEAGAGWVVPAGPAEGWVAALRQALEDETERRRRLQAARRLAARFDWDTILEPLVTFCTEPRTDPTRARFAHPLPTTAPPDAWSFRLRRRWLRLRGGGQ